MARRAGQFPRNADRLHLFGCIGDLGGIPETISGSFIVDPASGLQFGANIQLIGAAPFAGVYTVPSGGFPLPSANQIFGFGPGGTLSMHFADDLSTSNNPIASLSLTNNGNVVAGTMPMGAAVPIAQAIIYQLSNVTTTVFNGTRSRSPGSFFTILFPISSTARFSDAGWPAVQRHGSGVS